MYRKKLGKRKVVSQSSEVVNRGPLTARADDSQYQYAFVGTHIFGHLGPRSVARHQLLSVEITFGLAAS